MNLTYPYCDYDQYFLIVLKWLGKWHHALFFFPLTRLFNLVHCLRFMYLIWWSEIKKKVKNKLRVCIVETKMKVGGKMKMNVGGKMKIRIWSDTQNENGINFNLFSLTHFCFHIISLISYSSLPHLFGYLPRPSQSLIFFINFPSIFSRKKLFFKLKNEIMIAY